MTYVPLQIPPGIVRNGTKYQSKGTWYDCNLVRWYEEVVRPIGGWAYQSDDDGVMDLTGTPRGALGWEVSGGRNWQAYGTSDTDAADTRLYAFSLGTSYDISLVGSTELFAQPFTQSDAVDISTLGYTIGGAGYSKVYDNRAYRVWAGSSPLGSPYTDATHLTYGNGKTYDAHIDVKREETELIGQGAGLTFLQDNAHQSEWCAIYMIWKSATTVDIKMLRYDGSEHDGSTVVADVALAAGASIMIGVRIAMDTGVVTPYVADAVTGANRTDYTVWTHTDSTWHSDGNHLHTGVYWRGAGSAAHTRVALDNHTVDEVGAGFAASNVDSSVTGDVGGAGYYGAGQYGDTGSGPYGVGQPAGTIIDADVWHLDNFGNLLVACQVPSNDSIYSWNPATPSTEAALIEASAGTVPTQNRGIVVTPERFLVALGANGNGRLVWWSDREDHTFWDETDSTAESGYLELEGRGKLMAGKRARAETLLWTDADLFSMQYVGGTFVYGFERKGPNCGLVAPQAVAEFSGGFIWMGKRGFYVYDGYVRKKACKVQDYVFNDMNNTQQIKVCSWVNHEFGEVWWFYPSEGSDENDRYVVWNYEFDFWFIGKMERTCAIEATATNTSPTLLNAGGAVLIHESGWDHTIEQAANFTPYVESGPMEIGNGGRNMHVHAIIPDEETLGEVQATMYTALYPTSATERSFGPFTIDEHQDVRAHGRWARLLLEETAAGSWRVGTYRMDISEGGRR